MEAVDLPNFTPDLLIQHIHKMKQANSISGLSIAAIQPDNVFTGIVDLRHVQNGKLCLVLFQICFTICLLIFK